MRGFFKNNGKSRGLKAKMPFFSLSPRWETGERCGVTGGLGLGGGREEVEKRERLKGSIPPSILGKEARRAEIHGGGRQ